MMDMHLHTKWSDGSLTVAELVQKLKENQISHAVLTDHDCILGNEQFQLECNRYNISTTVGTELEAYYDVNNSNYLHMLCYNFKDKDKLNSFLEEERSQRIYAINKAISILKKQHYNVNFEDVQNISEGRHLLINHLCILLEQKKIVKSRYDAYHLFLDKTSKWYVPYPKPTVEEIIKIIYDVGGIPVLAHPKRIHMALPEKEAYIKHLKEIGLVGIEAYYGFDNDDERSFSTYIGEKYNLIQTVGSDWHCEEDNIGFGNQYISDEKEKTLRKVFFNE